MPLQATSGAASYDAFGGGVAAVPNYIEEVFSTYLWTTSASNQTLTTGIDMTKGALTWIKSRSNVFSHVLQTSAGGDFLVSNTTAAAANASFRLSDSSTGFTMGTDYYTGTPQTAVVWTFRKQPKFFDVVTWTGDGTDGRQIPHSLNAVPGCIIIKNTSNAASWQVYHRGNTSPETNWWDNLLVLNATNASASFPNTLLEPTSTNINLEYANVNASGQTYVAYLFAHNAGGFGLTGTDNVISCGSFTTDGSGAFTVTLGYEPQWVLVKATQTSGNSWILLDNMRGWSQSDDNALFPNLSNAESVYQRGNPTATGFTASTGFWTANEPHIYIAIRRGPMKVPTSGTSVFIPVAQNTGANAVVTTGFPVDLSISDYRSGGGGAFWIDRLRGSTTTSSRSLVSASTGAEYVQTSFGIGLDNNNTIVDNFNNNVISSGPYAYWNFRRAPNFFDEVCYTGTGSATTQTHNLGVAPEMMITKVRTGSSTSNWAVYHKALGATDAVYLDLTNATTSWIAFWNNTAPTASVFSLGGSSYTNNNGGTLVAYLFATCAGVSKVGSYTGTATTLQIDCGFTGGARFVLIKRTDSTGDWYVWDSARGIVSGNDPYLLLNSTAAEVTITDYIDTYSAGFELSTTAAATVNVLNGTYIYLAIA